MSANLPALTPRKVIQALERGGFIVHRTSGSHRILKHPRDPRRRIVAPDHDCDLKEPALLDHRGSGSHDG